MYSNWFKIDNRFYNDAKKIAIVFVANISLFLFPYASWYTHLLILHYCFHVWFDKIKRINSSLPYYTHCFINSKGLDHVLQNTLIIPKWQNEVTSQYCNWGMKEYKDTLRYKHTVGKPSELERFGINTWKAILILRYFSDLLVTTRTMSPT